MYKYCKYTTSCIRIAVLQVSRIQMCVHSFTQTANLTKLNLYQYVAYCLVPRPHLQKEEKAQVNIYSNPRTCVEEFPCIRFQNRPVMWQNSNYVHTMHSLLYILDLAMEDVVMIIRLNTLDTPFYM